MICSPVLRLERRLLPCAYAAPCPQGSCRPPRWLDIAPLIPPTPRRVREGGPVRLWAARCPCQVFRRVESRPDEQLHRNDLSCRA